MFHNTPVLGGCPRGGRCSGILGLRRDLRNTISALIPTSRLLAGLTARAYNYMVSEAYKIVINIMGSSASHVVIIFFFTLNDQEAKKYSVVKHSPAHRGPGKTQMEWNLHIEANK